MSQVNQIQQIELSIDRARAFIEAGNALERLQANRDFKTIIKEGFFEQEAIRLVHVKSDPSMQTAEHQAAINKQMDAIGTLNQYFRTIYHQAAMAEKSLAQDMEERDAMLAEDVQ